jgi:hypothetical protein
MRANGYPADDALVPDISKKPLEQVLIYFEKES